MLGLAVKVASVEFGVDTNPREARGPMQKPFWNRRQAPLKSRSSESSQPTDGRDLTVTRFVPGSGIFSAGTWPGTIRVSTYENSHLSPPPALVAPTPTQAELCEPAVFHLAVKRPSASPKKCILRVAIRPPKANMSRTLALLFNRDL